MRKVKITFVCELAGETNVVPIEGVCGIAAILSGDVHDDRRQPFVVMSGERSELIGLAAGVMRSLFEHEGPEAVDRAMELYETCDVQEVSALGPSGDPVPINRLRDQP